MRRPWKIDDHEARRLAKAYALDVCRCGHHRGEHADRSGAPRHCPAPRCTCRNYGHAKEAPPLAL